MMSSAIVVRNLTSEPISIKRVEQFEDPNTLQSNSSGHILGTKNTTTAAPSSPKLGEHAQSFHHQELDITLASFEPYTLHTNSKEPASDEASIAKTSLRLTIQSPSGALHRIAVHPSYTQKSSSLCTPLSPGPETTYTSLFHPTRPTPHLTIHTHHLASYYATWMSKLPDHLPLSHLSIPGTHNSHTYYRALPSVRCQTVDISTQLANGIRFLDLRLQPLHATDPTKKDFILVHGSFPISLTGPKYFAPILQVVYDFLDSNPGETVLLSLKREGIGAATDAHLSSLLSEHYIKPNRAKWYTGSAIPCLGDVRGKIVLVRRFKTSTHEFGDRDEVGMGMGMGLDATQWPHNATHALIPSSSSAATFCLQDYCDVFVPASIPAKIQYATDHLDRAASISHGVDPGPIYLNFLSASNFWRKACWPENIARIVNRGIEEWMCVGHGLDNALVEEKMTGDADDDNGRVRRRGEGDGGTGVVVMDFVGEGGDWELVRLVVGMNMGILNQIQNEQ
jgi:1-phosphatidylinositol phosphodiesterase